MVGPNGWRTLDPPNSKIYNHSFEENHPIYEEDFKIIARCPEKTPPDTRIYFHSRFQTMP